MKRLIPLTLFTLIYTANTMAENNDPNLWLEDITGDKALSWVRKHNAQTEKALADNDEFKKLEGELLAILNNDEKIPYIGKMGDYYYNFWQDKGHQRGIWRRTTLEEYRKDKPQWDIILDIDALNKAENTNWVWHGADCLRPDYTRCLISLSRGGSDADETREFDLNTRSFIKDGFYRPEAKGGMNWIDENHVFIETDFGPHSMTTSGYPREARLWTRGTPMEKAETVYRGEETDMYIGAMHDDTLGYERDFVIKAIDFYHNELYLRNKDGSLNKIDAPDTAGKGVVRDWFVLALREDWELNGKKYNNGSLLVANFNDWMAGKRELRLLFEPTEHTSLAETIWTKNYLILNILDDVKNRLTVLDPQKDWAESPLSGAPAMDTISVKAVDSDENDDLWLTVSGFTTPTSLALTSVTNKNNPDVLKKLPAFFDAEGIVAEQHFVSSKDGTQIPYFLIHHKDIKLDGKNPTLLYGYGGFQIPLVPSYGASIGRAWLTRTTEDGRHGVYVIANIRGGGEYGPRWHQAALKEKRHKAYEDFAAVAEDLIKRNVTSPAHLGTQGGSNGGLLTGNMLTQYPQLFGAIVIQVPLLDMQRYSKLLAGASWIAEYGDPDKPEEWKYLQTFSPYHLFDEKKDYPPVLFTTSTRDDRVHPGHARKMMAKMEAAGKNALYYENIEGGHGGAADNKQRAYMSALEYQFLWQQLSK
ncbi:MAG: prolyl oligopeptidase family serine peptidase [Cardiobacteriaceae bacterium]|nr:prolyl oligopeptidase family serine peptidase [Cardiobacteriaceae bacterium]